MGVSLDGQSWKATGPNRFFFGSTRVPIRTRGGLVGCASDPQSAFHLAHVTILSWACAGATGLRKHSTGCIRRKNSEVPKLGGRDMSKALKESCAFAQLGRFLAPEIPEAATPCPWFLASSPTMARFHGKPWLLVMPGRSCASSNR